MLAPYEEETSDNALAIIFTLGFSTLRPLLFSGHVIAVGVAQNNQNRALTRPDGKWFFCTE